MSKGKVFVFVAHREQGKTTLMRRLADSINLPKMVSDIQGDWGVEYIDPLDLLDMCLEDSEKVYVFEDTTAIIPTKRLTKKFRSAIARSRKQGIVLMFAFHSLDFVPDDMFDMGIDGLFILRTKDDPDDIRRKWKNYPHIIDAWNRMMNKPIEELYNSDGTKKTFPKNYTPSQFRAEYIYKP